MHKVPLGPPPSGYGGPIIDWLRENILYLRGRVAGLTVDPLTSDEIAAALVQAQPGGTSIQIPTADSMARIYLDTTLGYAQVSAVGTASGILINASADGTTNNIQIYNNTGAITVEAPVLSASYTQTLQARTGVVALGTTGNITGATGGSATATIPSGMTYCVLSYKSETNPTAPFTSEKMIAAWNISGTTLTVYMTTAGGGAPSDSYTITYTVS